MAVAETSQRQPVFTLSWAATAACLVAFAGLFLKEGGSVALPLFAAALVISHFVPFRLGNQLGQFGPVIILLCIPVFLENIVFVPKESLGLFDATRARYSGELSAAILVMEAWRQRPDAGGRGVIVLLLSAVVLAVSANTMDEGFVRVLAPAYGVCVALALPDFVSASEPHHRGAVAAARAMRLTAIVAAMAIGFGTYAALHGYKADLTNWGMRFLSELPTPKGTGTGLSDTPTLGFMHDTGGESLDRVLRIEGKAEVSHLRGLAFSDYSGGHWGPSRTTRLLRAIDPLQFEGRRARGESIRITRLADIDGVLVAPLNAASLDLSGEEGVQWLPEEGGPLHTQAPAPSTYGVVVPPDDAYQGPLCRPPTAGERARLLVVPPEIDPRVGALARQAASGTRSLLDRARAIESYLMSHHTYSLRFYAGAGDPVTTFVLGTRGAHCEYFASAAALMLRCVGIPARYVVGYYAHEGDGPDAIVVRQRDAHAWAEAWIDGVGWVTVDATPADGRPDRTAEPLPAWTRLKEWLQDRFHRAVAAIRDADPRTLALALGGSMLAALAYQWATRRRKRARRTAALTYPSPAAEIAALGARFEALCRRSGFLCPANRTWQQFLSERAGGQAAAHPLEIGRALAFVRAYNAARFGVPDAAAAARLTTMLEQLER